MIFDTIVSLPFYVASIISVDWFHRPLITSEAYQSTVSEHNLFKHAENLFLFSKAEGANTRVASSVGHNATVDYIKSRLDSTGFYDTYLQHFPYTYSVGSATFSSGDTTYGTSWFTYGPAGTVIAPLTIVNNFGCAQSDFPVKVAGKIALIIRGYCPFSDKVALSGVAGAVGTIIYNNQDGPFGSVTLSNSSNPLGPYIPVGGISGHDGEALVARIRSGREVVGNLKVVAINEDRETANVVATTKSGDRDNIVALGGHTDSVSAGPGINDNGSGSMAVLELALQLPRFRVRNAVRFGFWSGEEFGLLGATYYTTHLSEEELSKIALYLNFDMLASPNFGYFVYDGDGSVFGVSGPLGSGHIEKTFKDFFRNSDLRSAPTKFDGRSDYSPFFDAGIPVGGLLTGAEEKKDEEGVTWWGGKAGVAYDVCYHQACDTLENLNVTAWVRNTRGAAHAVATYSTTLEGIPRFGDSRKPSKSIVPSNDPQWA